MGIRSPARADRLLRIPIPAGQPNTSYTYAVTAVDGNGTASQPGNSITITPDMARRHPVQFGTPTGGTQWSAVRTLTTPMSNFQLGDDSTGRTYSWFADDLTVSSVQPAF